MYTLKTIKKLFFGLALIGMSSLAFVNHVHAQSLTIPASIDWYDTTQSCTGTINGQSSYFYPAVAGDTATFNITNHSSQYILTVDITESGQSTYTKTLAPGGTASATFPVNSEITLAANGNACQSGHGGPAILQVEATTGTLSCSIQDNQVWTVAVNYSNIFQSASLYRGDTYVQRFPFTNKTVIKQLAGLFRQ